MSRQPVIIIGAPRSGTNMLRDVLTSFSGVATWPCDEINYIWRHGNVGFPSDELTANMASPAIKKYIRQQFDWVFKKYNAHTVVEKTCANSLRVDFVDTVVPEAKYIFIHRDGLDVVGSAKLRWTAELDIMYLLKKARFVPRTDLPYYAIRYFGNRIYRIFSGENRLAFWGPQLNDMGSLLNNYSLEQLCAIQWQRCVEKSETVFSGMPEDKKIAVSYENMVSSPQNEIQRVIDFLGLNVHSNDIEQATAGVTNKSVGKGRRSLNKDVIASVSPLISNTMARYGYL